MPNTKGGAKQKTVERQPKKKKRINSRNGAQPDPSSESNMASNSTVSNTSSSMHMQGSGNVNYGYNMNNMQQAPPPNLMYMNSSPNQFSVQSPQAGFNPAMCTPYNPPPVWAQELIVSVELITKRLDKLDVIESSVQCVKQDIKSLSDRVGEVEKSQHFIDSKFEESKQRSEKHTSELAEIRKSLEDTLLDNDRLASDIVDLQCRSMRDNLLFFNIDEKADEDCAVEIQTFCEKNLEYAGKLQMDRAHRIGRRYKEKIRPIVVKFREFPQREEIRKSSHKLKDTKYSIGEQYPKVVQERRKQLLPVLKHAKGQGKRAWLVRDRLYIDEKLYTGPGAGAPL